LKPNGDFIDINTTNEELQRSGIGLGMVQETSPLGLKRPGFYVAQKIKKKLGVWGEMLGGVKVTGG